jgi:hypothetical protein
MENHTSLETIQKTNKMTDNFLVKLEDNTYGIRFIGFKVRDVDTGEIFHQFKSKNPYELDYFADHILEYSFPQKMLKANTIGTDLCFVVGDKPVKNLDFIEKHYINGELMTSYEFNFPLFMPKSENNIEFIYSIPKLKDEIKSSLNKGEDIKASSDTFILVDKKLVIHRRAFYTYTSTS